MTRTGDLGGSEPGDAGEVEFAHGDRVLRSLDTLERLATRQSDWFKGIYKTALRGGPQGEMPAGPSPLAHWTRNEMPDELRAESAVAELVGQVERLERTARRVASALNRAEPRVSAAESFVEAAATCESALRRVQHDLWSRLVRLDPLTGVPNRYGMEVQLDVERERSRRSGRPCTVAMIDLDHFKRVNDSRGHQYGDAVLRAVAATLAETLRPYDLLFRYGGEEFLVCLPDTGADEARAALERSRGQAARAAGDDPPVTVSIGLAPLEPERDVAESVRHADQALSAAKHGGRDCIRSWPADLRKAG